MPQLHPAVVLYFSSPDSPPAPAVVHRISDDGVYADLTVFQGYAQSVQHVPDEAHATGGASFYRAPALILESQLAAIEASVRAAADEQSSDVSMLRDMLKSLDEQVVELSARLKALEVPASPPAFLEHEPEPLPAPAADEPKGPVV